MEILPTQYRQKAPRHLSYPFSAKELTEAFGETAQARGLQLWFVVHGLRWATETERARRSGQLYPVLSVRFRYRPVSLSSADFMIERGEHDPKWEVNVYAVSREHRAAARDALQEEANPVLRGWLDKPRPETWFQGTKQITALFSEGTHEVVVEGDA